MRGNLRGIRWLLALCVVAWALLGASASAATSSVPSAPKCVPVLIVDAGLGDEAAYRANWLGTSKQLAENGASTLLWSGSPIWFGSSGAPDTYLLVPRSGSPVSAEQIAWALDAIAARHPEGKAVVIAHGVAGLQARAYLEDVATPKQSDRADVVGLVMLGTPNNGTTLAQQWPRLELWSTLASAVGLKAEDLLPGSPYIAKLNGSRLPNVVRAVVVQGTPVSFAGKVTDGVSLREDTVLATDLASGVVDHVPVAAAASELPLERAWRPATKQGGQLENPIDGKVVQNLELSPSFSSSAEARSAAAKFYSAWFADGAPVTHVSSALVLDSSGSMKEKVAGGTKLAAAKRAADDFLAALDARSASSAAVPEDATVITFNESPKVAAESGESMSAARKAVASVKAGGNTDVGKALSLGVESLSDAPKAGDKVLVLLSDGVNTVGLKERGVIAGPVAKAAKLGIRIDTIALGGVGSADVGFLKSIARKTGGTFRQARDAFELRRDFLRARYTSLGTLVADENVDASKASVISLGKSDQARGIEVGVVADGKTPSWRLVRSGREVPKSEVLVAKGKDGVLSLIVDKPAAGEYQLELSDGPSRAHVFAVKRVDAFAVSYTTAQPDNTATIMVIGLAILAFVGVAATVGAALFRRQRKTEKAPPPRADEPAVPNPEARTDGGEA